MKTSSGKQHKYAQSPPPNLMTQRTFLTKNKIINQPINTLGRTLVSDSTAGSFSNNEASVFKELIFYSESFLTRGSYPTHRQLHAPLTGEQEYSLVSKQPRPDSLTNL